MHPAFKKRSQFSEERVVFIKNTAEGDKVL